jgi:hypothetical protein
MNLDRAGDMIWMLGAMLLVGSGLLLRFRHAPLPMGVMAVAWVTIFALLFLIAKMIDSRP